MSTTNEPPNEPTGSDAESAAAVDPLDERLSAALDGPASGSGSAPTAETPADDARTARRRRDLGAARDLLAVPPPRLDDMTRRRMLRTAVAASTTPSRSSNERARRRLRVATVAAVVLAVVGLAGWKLASLNLSSSKEDSNAKTASAATSAPGTPVDLHEVSDPSVLRRRVEAALGAPHSTAAPQPGNTTTSPRVAASPTRCVSTVRVPAGDTPELLATATFRGAPALVVVARDPSRTLVFVLATTDCRLLSSQFLKR
jgi:hypothetical protein